MMPIYPIFYLLKVDYKPAKSSLRLDHPMVCLAPVVTVTASGPDNRVWGLGFGVKGLWFMRLTIYGSTV